MSSATSEGNTSMDVNGLEWVDKGILLDTSEKDRAYLVRSQSGKYLRLSPTAFHLVRSLQQGRTAEELAESIGQKGGKPVTAAQVEQAFADVKRRLQEAEAKDTTARSGFWARRDVLPERLVVAVSSMLTWAYRPWVVRTLLFFAVGMAISLVALRGHTQLAVTSEVLLYAYGLYFVSLLLHEFGHSTACLHYGARPSAIGVGVYLVFPVLYSDVSAAWSLTRWQRSMVDLGGIYFQSVVGAIFFALFLVTEWPPLLLAIFGIMGTVGFSLNPIFKFDGYWAIADSLGVTNLSQQKTRVLQYFWQTLRGHRPPRGLPWPRWLVIVLAFYSVFSFVIIVFFLWRMLPFMIDRVVAYPGIVRRLIEDIVATGELPNAEEIHAFFGSTFATALACIILWRFIGNLGKSLYARLRAGISRPVTARREQLATNENQPSRVEGVS